MFLQKFWVLLLSCMAVFGSGLEGMSVSSRRGAQAQEQIGVRTFEYDDAARKRPVVVEFWYPTADQGPFEPEGESPWIHPKEVRNASLSKRSSKYPLILMSHGHRGDRRERTWLVEHLVKQGFAVAAVEHFGNTRAGYNPLVSIRFWERARDVTFALNQILKEPHLKDRIDPARIGFVGYSMGGTTGFALAGARAENVKETILQLQAENKEVTSEMIEQIDFSAAGQSYTEPRIRAMLLICPAAFAYPASSLRQIKIPVALIAAVQDEVLPYREHALQIIQHLRPVKLKVLGKEISHYSFSNRCSELGKKMLHRALHTDRPKCNRASLHREMGSFAVDFFKEILGTSSKS